jgi:hypothetical protein
MIMFTYFAIAVRINCNNLALLPRDGSCIDTSDMVDVEADDGLDVYCQGADFSKCSSRM